MNLMSHAALIPFIGIFFYLIIFILISYFVVKAVRKSFRIREEQNQLLRELIEKISK